MIKNTAGNLTYYTSQLLDDLDVAHGFFTRHGGVSTDKMRSLNIKKSADDEDKNVSENRKRMCTALGLDAAKLIFANQLGHGDKGKFVGRAQAGQEFPGLDSLVTKTVEIPLALSVADCAPVILAAKDKAATSVMHVSWRSLNAGIIQTTLDLLNSKELVVAVGPCIAVDSYEVQQDFVDALKPRFSKFLNTVATNPLFDLPVATVAELERHGIGDIDTANIDTATNTNDFYSYREEGTTGRFGAIVSL